MLRYRPLCTGKVIPMFHVYPFATDNGGDDNVETTLMNNSNKTK